MEALSVHIRPNRLHHHPANLNLHPDTTRVPRRIWGCGSRLARRTRVGPFHQPTRSLPLADLGPPAPTTPWGGVPNVPREASRRPPRNLPAPYRCENPDPNRKQSQPEVHDDCGWSRQGWRAATAEWRPDTRGHHSSSTPLPPASPLPRVLVPRDVIRPSLPPEKQAIPAKAGG
jgi:hypothetical protein